MFPIDFGVNGIKVKFTVNVTKQHGGGACPVLQTGSCCQRDMSPFSSVCGPMWYSCYPITLTFTQCGNLAREGLRTLVVARKILSDDQYQEFQVNLFNPLPYSPKF